MGLAAQKPDVDLALKGLKDFQRRTVDYAFRRLYLDDDSTHRFLVADEVGLGKTLVARGVIARAVAHLWDHVERVDVIYVCSNADIARQNINKLRLDPGHDFARATRATLLPIQLHDLADCRVNYVSMTPGTSLEPSGGMGMAKERALLWAMLRDHWNLHEGRSANVLRGYVSADRFDRRLREWLPDQQIDRGLHEMFLKDLDAKASGDRAAGKPDLQGRFLELCDLLPRRDSRLDDDQHQARRELIGELRAALGRTCIQALRPDLVILDEFQRFKHLLDPKNDEAELAQSLLQYADEREGRAEAVRVLLLSATPYKMYTLAHEEESGENDHYEDFVATYDFLVRQQAADISSLRSLLKDYRAAMMRLADGSMEELRRLKNELEVRLRRVMARTERLAATHDRSGMLKERPSPDLQLRESDVRQYVTLSRVARALDHGDIVEYWKSAPYLLNFMDDYELKKGLRDAAGNGTDSAVMKALDGRPSCLLPWADVLAYSQIDPGNARLRSLIAETVGRDLWKLLWLPPSLPYYEPGGVFAGIDPVLVTKRLVFSSWKVVPKVIAALLSHEAERRAVGLTYLGPDGSMTIANSTDGRKKITALLRFSRAEGRLTGMPVLGLIYPSLTLARLLDPAALSISDANLPTVEDLLDYAQTRLGPLVDALVTRWAAGSEIDESWYWAAPILLDLVQEREASDQFWRYPKLSKEWSGEEDRVDADGELEAESAWAAHVDQARQLFEDMKDIGAHALGQPPPDLVAVLAEAVFGNPAVVALRSLARVSAPGSITDPQVRLAAGRVAWRFRNLFNLPEVIALIRGLNREEPYWRRVVEYAIDGGLQAVLDEYAHVLRDNLGVSSQDGTDVAGQIGEAIVTALGLRSATVGVDEIAVNARDNMLRLDAHRMRSRFAARFGQDQSDAEGEVNRAEQVRAAFNSPFWPFVLATTSVGQEGLDFHHYCHAVVHWNLPSNPVDLEQREGRIHRFKGHAIRKNVAKKYGAPQSELLTDPWAAAFDRAAVESSGDMNELVPFWVFPCESGASIDRYVPALPLSRDADRLNSLRSALAIYRMVFGQPRQDELVKYLQTRLPPEVVEQCVRELRIDLEPPRNGSQTDRPLEAGRSISTVAQIAESHASTIALDHGAL
ncbi:MAG TPA: helicase-related protein [Phycisphaerae bacterium]|nr:helicase-related protein [Phycisphaerae bacterium]